MTNDLETQLRALGASLDVDETVNTDAVLARLDGSSSRSPAAVALRVAAAVLLVIAVAAVAFPAERRTVADWLGIEGVRIERRPDTSVPALPDPLDGRGVGTVISVGPDEVLLDEFIGTLDNPALVKVATAGTGVVPVSVNNSFGLWIDGQPHQVSYVDSRGEIVFEGFAGNTLLWQDGAVIRRLEGFGTLADATRYAASVGN